MNRRQAFQILGGVAALVAGGYAWRERRGLTRADLESDDPVQSPRHTVISPAMEAMLYHASLAPSGHNTQPWTVRVKEGALAIGSDRARWLPKVDPSNRELALSIGAFLENLIVAAPSHGYLADYEVTAELPSDRELLDVTLRSTPVRADPLDRLRTRRTVRSGHLSRELTDSDVRGLSAAFPQEALFVSPTSREGRYLAEGTIEANRVQGLRDEAQGELADWIRWTNAEARARPDGLTPESMEISGLAGWYVRHFMNRATVQGTRFRQQGVDRVRDQVARCGGWMVVTSQDSTLPALIETGRRTNRMWLNARDRSIAIHPMSQMLEEAPFRDQIGRELGVTGHVQFILRVGYIARYPDPVSLRRRVSSFLITS
ncbi:MAG TPA: nitroreductase [Vicinamibacteria bacterium]|nr:nitroreductase [Vicinamibacteria bacterium]